MSRFSQKVCCFKISLFDLTQPYKQSFLSSLFSVYCRHYFCWNRDFPPFSQKTIPGLIEMDFILPTVMILNNVKQRWWLWWKVDVFYFWHLIIFYIKVCHWSAMLLRVRVVNRIWPTLSICTHQTPIWQITPSNWPSTSSHVRDAI